MVPATQCLYCGKAVDDPAQPCPNCGRTVNRSGILASNVDTLAQTAEAPKRGSTPLFVGLGIVALAVVAGIVIVFALAPGPTRAPPAASAPRPTSASVAAPAPGQAFPDVNGIRCDALESTLFHIHVHVAIFANGEEQIVPYGIGIGEPWEVIGSSQGPFVADGTCFYWMHTHTENGVVHVESPVQRVFTLGDFFAVWGTPLSASRVGDAEGQVTVYVNGVRDTTAPADIRLSEHLLIQLDVGTDVAPQPFRFAPGD